jgi:hypothetical protein
MERQRLIREEVLEMTNPRDCEYEQGDGTLMMVSFANISPLTEPSITLSLL